MKTKKHKYRLNIPNIISALITIAVIGYVTELIIFGILWFFPAFSAKIFICIAGIAVLMGIAYLIQFATYLLAKLFL